jgi:fumarate hydratase class II
MTATRIESDTMGDVAVPADRLWGAQTQRSLENFRIGGETMPLAVVHALAVVKRCAARTNAALGLLPPPLCDCIVAAADAGWTITSRWWCGRPVPAPRAT